MWQQHKACALTVNVFFFLSPGLDQILFTGVLSLSKTRVRWSHFVAPIMHSNEKFLFIYKVLICARMWITLFIFLLQVVIDAFRLINANMMVLGHEPRQTTSNLGHLNKPSIQVPFLYRILFLYIYYIYEIKIMYILLLMYNFTKSHISCAGFDSWTQQTLLLHYDQLQEKWIGTEGLNLLMF